MSEYQRITTVTDDGVTLTLARFEALAPRRAVLLCTHAMMANSSYFRSKRGGFAQFLAAAGIEVYLLDWRGHGHSVPPSPRRDSWGFEAYVTKDLHAAMAQVAATAGIPVADVCYLGHSLGGLVALAGFGTGAAPLPRKLSLWASSVWLPGPWGSLKRRLIMGAYALTSWPLGYAPVRRLRFGSDDEPRQYVNQLAAWALRGKWVARDGTNYMTNAANVSCPVFAVTGDGDRICAAPDAETLRARLTNAKPMRRVGTTHGDAIDPDHFTLFTDNSLQPLWRELIEFLTT